MSNYILLSKSNAIESMVVNSFGVGTLFSDLIENEVAFDFFRSHYFLKYCTELDQEKASIALVWNEIDTIKELIRKFAFEADMDIIECKSHENAIEVAIKDYPEYLI